MTEKKARNIQPYTFNMALAGLGSHDESLMPVLNRFFNSEKWPRISERVYQAMTCYNLYLQTNPDRKSTEKQRYDQHDLIECMKELNVRLNRSHIPQPLYDAVRSAYVPVTSLRMGPTEEMLDLMRRGGDPKLLEAARESVAEQNTLRGKENLKEEIRDLLLRLRRLQKLFEANPIPTPITTNPGKPERAQLIVQIAAIFDEFTSDSYLDDVEDESSPDLQRQKERDKNLFVQEVLAVFHITSPSL